MTKENLSLKQILDHLKENSDPSSLIGMAKVGITPEDAYGTKIPVLRSLAKKIGKNHSLALDLWTINKRETRILACMIDDPKLVTEEQLESWISEFSYWELCDQCIMNLVEKTPFAYSKAIEWATKEKEYTKRAGYVTMARLAGHDKKISNEKILGFLPIIDKGLFEREHTVKLAVSWALREIGKRNLFLNSKIQEYMKEKQLIIDMTVQWITKDVLKDITRDVVIQKLKEKEK